MIELSEVLQIYIFKAMSSKALCKQEYGKLQDEIAMVASLQSVLHNSLIVCKSITNLADGHSDEICPPYPDCQIHFEHWKMV